MKRFNLTKELIKRLPKGTAIVTSNFKDNPMIIGGWKVLESNIKGIKE